MKIGRVHYLALFFLLCFASPGYSLDIVVSKDVPLDSISVDELRDIYLGRKIFWGEATDFSSNRIHPAFNTGKARVSFFSLIGLKEVKYKKKWIRITLSGKGTPPFKAETDDEVIDIVKHGKGRIGFVDHWKGSEDVKVIDVVK